VLCLSLEAKELSDCCPNRHITGLGDDHLSAYHVSIGVKVDGSTGAVPLYGCPPCAGIDAANHDVTALHGEGNRYIVYLNRGRHLGGAGTNGVAADVPDAGAGVAAAAGSAGVASVAGVAGVAFTPSISTIAP